MYITLRNYEVVIKRWSVLKCCACWLTYGIVENKLLPKNTGARRPFVGRQVNAVGLGIPTFWKGSFFTMKC